MKLNKLLLLGATSFLASLLSVADYSFANAGSSTGTSNGSIGVVAQKQSPTMSGTFVAGEHPASGKAQIVTEAGKRYLVLDSAFRTSDQGPDLHVLLDPEAKPPQKYADLSRYVNLGKLQKFNGTQRYPIPEAINLANFKSVVVWCRMANATFAYAPLGGTSSASSQPK